MKISSVDSKYLLTVGERQLLIEDSRNERGERLVLVSTVSSFTLPNGEKWTPKVEDAKTVKREELPPELKRALRKLLALS
ncbi:hypothetical protein HS1genome_0078 [Sulfodiicoccus acidiphilus]|uniref:Uncharacterized protein n=1 Tax=Sulfodiicoccus acidiphilus TaxID=1670455 RepID=A0A348B0I7_9CREN|nr:hypothetical protein [Sulfodiicoccus acidiphilus]BBD71689.1 hypothetical protein HS1genome_0078 [Sulfodiicoccus acidiphilus]GGT86586.1 hypothetical protein GCM10007116_00680 [Sulfodiicoccus acidiphilus]